MMRLCDCTVSKTLWHFVSPHLHFVTEAGSQGSLRSPVPFAPYKGGRTLAPFYKGGRKGGFFHVILKRLPLRFSEIVTVQNLFFYTGGKLLNSRLW